MNVGFVYRSNRQISRYLYNMEIEKVDAIFDVEVSISTYNLTRTFTV